MPGRGERLRRTAIAFVLLFLMLLSIGNAGDGVDSKVDDRVINELQENEKVDIIVILKDEVETGIGIFSTREQVTVNDVVDDLNIQKEKEFVIFKNTDKYLGIIFYDEAIEDYKKAIKKIDGHFNTYVFSMTDKLHEDKFDDVMGKVKLMAIPEVILQVYREIFK